ncbi:uncharacterized protein C8Q71DRAFT_849263 [Rhodofomes roseus]|uniref:Uncharacterized protein n=1 Tax=Rhodofomes roseus TaxID=34475 RepID=A0ABQ8KD58_9APHY|nr:uncharacterized protein C8Q71DRAFT_849263 [Rhodofomes roseus]KAH9835030.1 hypothetical protein C8Q71DRAFT_849263 [Rhodofomes roseus]
MYKRREYTVYVVVVLSATDTCATGRIAPVGKRAMRLEKPFPKSDIAGAVNDYCNLLMGLSKFTNLVHSCNRTYLATLSSAVVAHPSSALYGRSSNRDRVSDHLQTDPGSLQLVYLRGQVTTRRRRPKTCVVMPASNTVIWSWSSRVGKRAKVGLEKSLSKLVVALGFAS